MKEPRARPAIVLEEAGEALTVLPGAYETTRTVLSTRASRSSTGAINVTRESGSAQPCLGKHVDIN